MSGENSYVRMKAKSHAKLLFIALMAIVMTFTMMPFASFANSTAPGNESSQTEVDSYADPVTTDDTFKEGSEDYLGYDPLYVVKYHNPDYVNLDNTGVDRFVSVVTSAKGVASYTIDKDNSLDEDTVLAAIQYEMPVYNVDDKSDYYIAIPNVNKFNNNFKAFGLRVAYNNDHGETIDGWKYEKGILYIPKTAIDNPANEYEVPEGFSIGVQLNYSIGSDADFSKAIPVQVLANNKVNNKTLEVGNIFDDAAVQVETDVKNRKTDDVSVYLNGQMMPINDEAWTYDSETGVVSIAAMPGVVSSINVVFENQSAADALMSALSLFTSKVYAVGHGDMAYFKNTSGKEVLVRFDRSKMFVGWRGQYTSDVNWPVSAGTVDSSPGAANSVKYLYGVNAQNLSNSSFNGDPDAATANLWAIQSYAVGSDVRVIGSGAGTISPTEKITHKLFNKDENGPYPTGSYTIYEWLYGEATGYAKSVKKSNNAYGKGADGANGIGGANNFVFKAPVSQTVKGFNTVFAPNQSSNPDIAFTFENMTSEPWLVAGCSELDTAAAEGSGGVNDVSMVCLGMKDDYVIFAFVNVAKSQNMTAIYKFKTQAQVPVKVKKVSSNTSVSNGNNCYAVSGAKFGVYETQANANAKTNAIKTLETGANGETPEIQANVGETYYFRELQAPKGHWLNDTVKAVTVNDSMTVSMSDPPVVGTTDVLLKKVFRDESGDEVGDRFNEKYNLSGAQFTVKYYDNLDGNNSGSAKRTWVLETNAKGELKLDDATMIISGTAYTDSNGKQVWPIGTYTFEEKTAPAGFLKNTNVFKGTLNPVNGYQTNANKPAPKWTMLNSDEVDANVIKNEADRAVAVTEVATFADLTVRKVDRGTGRPEPEGDGSFDKTVFSVINVSTKDGQPRMIADTKGNFIGYGEEVCKITTNAEGVATTKGMDPKGYLQCGEGFAYKLVEVDPPTGYLNDDWTTTVELKQADENKVVEAPIKRDEPVIRGGVKIHKDDNDLADQGVEGADNPQGDAILAGAEFTIVNRSAKSVVVRDVPYLSDTTPVVAWDVLYKYPITNGTKEVKPNEVVGVIRTDGAGNAATLANDLPYGTYEITETKPSTGYKIDTTWKVTFSVREDGVIVDKTKPQVEEPVIRGGVKVQKWDKELDKSEALGGKDHDATSHEGPDLNNIKFTIKNVSNHSVVTPIDIDASVKDSVAPTDIDYSPKAGKFTDVRLQEVKKGDVVGVITTKWSDEDKAYVAYTQKDALPYGTYEVWESRTNKYYELTDKHVSTFHVREDGSIVTQDTNRESLVWKDYVWRQGFEMTKIFDGHSGRGGYIPFKVTNTSTGEYHYVVTDANGYMNTEKIKHSQNTNAYDEMIDKALEEGKVLTQDDFKKMRLSEDGVDVTTPGYWFFLGEDGSKAPVDDKKAALPYGKYEIEEIKVDINEGYGMQKFEFWVNQDEDKSYDTNYKVVNLDTITNDEISIKTNAVDEATGTHEGLVSEETTVVDEVEYKGLVGGKTYVMKGSLMKKITDEEGNVSSAPLQKTVKSEDGKEELVDITAEKEFVAEKDGTGKVSLEFTFDSSLLNGSTVVAFEDLYRDGVKVATHADIEDKNQTVYFPSIGTVAKDKETGEKTLTETKGLLGLGSEKATVVDTIKYVGLVPGNKYEARGTLMKVVKGEDGALKAEALLDKDGKEITSKKSFKADAETGSVDVEFTFATDGITAAKIVVFEELYNKEDKLVAEHKDPADADQTVNLPAKPSYEMYKIRTTNATPKGDASDKFGFKTGDVVSYDVVIKNTGNVDLTMDVTDQFEDAAKEYFTTPVYKEVKGGTENSVAEDKNTVNITVKAGETATVTYEATVTSKAKELLAPAESDSDSLDKDGKPCNQTEQANKPIDDGYTNTAKTSKVKYPDPDNPDKDKEWPEGDKEDIAQTPVKQLEIETTATDAESGAHVGLVRKDVKITDKVAYNGLTPGKTYTLVGTLMDKETGKPVTANATAKADGKSDTQSTPAGTSTATETSKYTYKAKVFAYTEAGAHYHFDFLCPDLEDGSQKWEGFTSDIAADGTFKSEKTKGVLTVCEKCKGDNVIEVSKTDTATSESKDANTNASTKSSATSQATGGITATKTFKAENGDGSVTLEFALDGSALGNKTVVAFERLYEGKEVNEDKLLATHEDINDEAQSVHYPTIDTKASYKDGVLTDTVTYKNLIPGLEYEVSGVLMDKASGNSMEITAMKKFTPKAADGTVDMKFSISKKELEGKTAVVFEEVKLKGKVVAEHKDINDKDQTVKIDKVPGSKTSKSSSTNKSGTPDRSGYKTGDFLPYIIGAILAALIAAITIIYRRRIKGGDDLL